MLNGARIKLDNNIVFADGEGMMKKSLAPSSLALLQKAMYSIIKGCNC